MLNFFPFAFKFNDDPDAADEDGEDDYNCQRNQCAADHCYGIHGDLGIGNGVSCRVIYATQEKDTL